MKRKIGVTVTYFLLDADTLPKTHHYTKYHHCKSSSIRELNSDVKLNQINLDIKINEPRNIGHVTLFLMLVINYP